MTEDTQVLMPDGVRMFREGSFTAIRNPAPRRPDSEINLTAQKALERLAALSLLARYVNESVPVAFDVNRWGRHQVPLLPREHQTFGPNFTASIGIDSRRVIFEDWGMPTLRYMQPLIPISPGIADTVLTAASMCLAASTYLLSRGTPGGNAELLGIGGIVIALAAAFTATLALGAIPFDAKDHLRPGERRTLTIRSSSIAATVTVLLMWPAIAWQIPFPLSVAAAHCITTGLLIRWATLAYVRLLRDANRRNCGGSYDNCFSCDTACAILDLWDFLNAVDANTKGEWLIDPHTGKRLYLDSHQYGFVEEAVDDTGHRQQRVYMLAGLPGHSVARLTGVTVYDDGPVPDVAFTSVAEYDALSIDRAGIEALHAQLKRAVVNDIPVT